MRGDQLIRQWKIIQELLRAPEGLTVRDLARHFRVRGRTIYRDLETLQLAGFPIVKREYARFSLKLPKRQSVKWKALRLLVIGKK